MRHNFVENDGSKVVRSQDKRYLVRNVAKAWAQIAARKAQQQQSRNRWWIDVLYFKNSRRSMCRRIRVDKMPADVQAHFHASLRLLQSGAIYVHVGDVQFEVHRWDKAPEARLQRYEVSGRFQSPGSDRVEYHRAVYYARSREEAIEKFKAARVHPFKWNPASVDIYACELGK